MRRCGLPFFSRLLITGTIALSALLLSVHAQAVLLEKPSDVETFAMEFFQKAGHKCAAQTGKNKPAS